MEVEAMDAEEELWIEPKRAFRRRMRERRIKRLYKSILQQESWRFSLPDWDIYQSWTCSEIDDLYKEVWDRAVRQANAPAYCSRACCTNPRRFYKGLDFYSKTKQEKVNKDSYEQQIKELDDEAYRKENSTT